MAIDFDPQQFGPVFASLISGDRCRPLDAGSPIANPPADLRELTIDSAFAKAKIRDRNQAACCLSGVWLLYDFLDESHTLSQAISTPEGSFWHGIMHRREGDFGNAKYWFRRLGDHPVYEQLTEAFGEWDPFDFVDRCEQAVRHGTDADACRQAQQAEWEALFSWCYAHAL